MKFITIKTILKAQFMRYNDWTKSWENDQNYINVLRTIPSNPLSTWRLAMSQIKPYSKVLSAGCGAGREVKYLVRELKCKVVAVDHSKRMIQLSREFEPNAKYILGDMAEFKSRNKFDSVSYTHLTLPTIYSV